VSERAAFDELRMNGVGSAFCRRSAA